MINNTNNQEVQAPAKKRGRPAGSKNKPKTEESNVVFSKLVLVSYNPNPVKSKKSKPKLEFNKGGMYDELEWYRLRMKKNKDNEARVKAERSGQNKGIVRGLNKRK